MHNGNWDNGMDGGNWWWIPMTIMMIAVVVGIALIAVALARRSGYTSQPTSPVATPAATPKPSPQEVLAERLARGEIEPDDYRNRLEALATPAK